MRNIARDTIGELLELGKSTAKTTVKQVGQTFSPLKLTEKALGIKSDTNEDLSSSTSNSNNHTPLDTKKLEERYRQNDNIKYQSLKRKFHQRIKQEEKTIWERKKQEEKMKKKREEEEKRKKEEEKRKTQETLFIPQGKKRRSIFSPIKRKIQNMLSEFRGNKSRG